MKLIGIAGKKKTGKDTICKFIQEILSPKMVRRIGFADALKGEVARACSSTGKSVSVEYIEEHKDNFRLILQGWGTDFRRNLCGDSYWIIKVHHEINSLPDIGIYGIVFPDVRFLNEATYIKNMCGSVIHIDRSTSYMDLHSSENELNKDNFPYDYFIDNNTSLAELKLKTQDMLFTTHQYK